MFSLISAPDMEILEIHLVTWDRLRLKMEGNATATLHKSMAVDNSTTKTVVTMCIELVA